MEDETEAAKGSRDGESSSNRASSRGYEGSSSNGDGAEAGLTAVKMRAEVAELAAVEIGQLRWGQKQQWRCSGRR